LPIFVQYKTRENKVANYDLHPGNGTGLFLKKQVSKKASKKVSK